ncbi:ZYBA0S05-00276g1_1 [Zygosaccharomyces bailii CLIB 213]|uniref:Phosphotransferase n=1 Tax=Zygosaccharomyces bailii (strain CLIB 213 / ATCC 58445 / CBS 680 / BCRC 21525 / NBRC 1098 / NCYC 1416 / NRRL Y-2227) TaxID=1333698 RepID=A0A8J2XAV7_ZYGB2|nr:ZYBA0S05-00276g1_1 [Zygosaccharomyces bailii CLIB 213]
MVHLGPKKPPARKGSMADIPEDLMEQIRGLEVLFTVSPEKLRAVTKHFISELGKGLSKKGGNIPMIPGWVLEYPTGKERGHYLAIDLGGTNLRVVLIKLNGDRTFDSSQSKYKLPHHMRTTRDSKELFEFIADSLKSFLEEEFPKGTKEVLPLGFTFSYPASQSKINEGILQRWTKGFDIPGVEGHDVVPMLQREIAARNVPIEVVALINDTTGTLVASLYTDPAIRMGVIFGTGVNGAYYDVCSDIEKLEGKLPPDIPPTSPMAINCEYGSFDNEHLVLPRTKYDVMVDEQSPRPGQQAFEKMSSGYYLGEIVRLTLLDLHDQGFIFKDQDITKLKEPYIMDTTYPSKVEDDPFENLEDTFDLFQKDLGISTTVPERKLIRRLCELIGTRSARLSVCGIAAICQKRGYETAHIAADGSVFNKYPGFKERAAHALNDIYGWGIDDPAKHPIIIVPAEDGSGAGAAVIAALTMNRLREGKSVGVLTK